MSKTFIVDYGLGNLTSVKNAVSAVGGNPLVSSDPKELHKATNIILPGVGAFGEGMDALLRLGFIEPLTREVLEKGKFLMGICLGMQLLAEKGTEHGDFDGLGLIPGTVERLETEQSGLRIPHVGWNEVCWSAQTALTAGLDERSVFYFSHSYVFEVKNKDDILGNCDYGRDFAAVVSRENILGTQFHPEKSQKVGLKILENFIGLK